MNKLDTTLIAGAAIATSSITESVINNDTLSTVVQILIGIVTLIKLLKKDKDNTNPKNP